MLEKQDSYHMITTLKNDEKNPYRIKEQNMLSLAEYQHHLYRQPRLKYLYFELTDRCNLNCLHCGSGCTAANGTFLPLTAIEKTLHRVAEAYSSNNIMVCITGGEPLLHKDFFRIIRYAKTLGFSVGITTNGTLIDDRAAEKLAYAGLDTIAVSIDGLGDVHDKFRQISGCFDKAVAAIHSLKKVGIEPQVITVVHSGNIDSLDEMFGFMRSEDIYSWRLVNVEPIGRTNINKDILLSADQLKGLFDFIRAKRWDNENDMDITYGCSHFLTYEYENTIRDYYFQCMAGTMTASIMANGDIGACLDIERRPDLVQGNIFRDDFVDIWENRFHSFRTDRTLKSKTCRDCEFQKVCLGDSAHTWDYDNNEPLYCVSIQRRRNMI